MSWLKLASAAFFSLASCVSAPQERGPGRATLEWQAGSYDGIQITGRLLIRAQSGSIRIDKRLVPRAHVHMSALSECDSGQPVSFILADALVPPANEGDLLILTPGYWYGTTVRFRLFSEHFTGRGPECVAAQLTVLSFDGTPVATTAVRAMREPRQ